MRRVARVLSRKFKEYSHALLLLFWVFLGRPAARFVSTLSNQIFDHFYVCLFEFILLLETSRL